MGALKTDVRIADEILSGQSIKKQPNDAGRNLFSGLLTPGVRPRKSIKRAPAKKRVTSVAKQRKRHKPKKNEADIFDDGFRA